MFSMHAYMAGEFILYLNRDVQSSLACTRMPYLSNFFLGHYGFIKQLTAKRRQEMREERCNKRSLERLKPGTLQLMVSNLTPWPPGHPNHRKK